MSGTTTSSWGTTITQSSDRTTIKPENPSQTEHDGAKMEHGKELNVTERLATALNGTQRLLVSWWNWVSAGHSPLWTKLAV
ncbi:hypothetical protein [Lentzea aerocolonigenes]|uniref:hypothetical protein n=1 Tax=Lentzea aerocolonigenes TaxID=68170 RepID=UPI0012E26C66|nr:hypothetical protein [Lentzea aerocolonigenes]